jgi:hypothetical protein
MMTKRLDPKFLLELTERMEPKPMPSVRPGRPKLVCDHGQVVADAVVIVSPRDPNWRRDCEVRVRR